MTVSKESAEVLIKLTYSRCSGVSSVSSVSSVMPMMPFIGVRISWLILARNSPLARVACSSFWLSASREVFAVSNCCWLSRKARNASSR